MSQRIKSFSEFYPHYLSEHQNYVSRVLHVTGTTLFFVFVIAAVYAGNALWLWGCPLAGYGFAWVGHFFFERNKPGTFHYPLWSLVSDFKLYFEILFGSQKLRAK